MMRVPAISAWAERSGGAIPERMGEPAIRAAGGAPAE
jgi:hypothetical protein